jgi:short-subunit dehydrogenase
MLFRCLGMGIQRRAPALATTVTASLDGRAVLITGAAGGLGRTIATALARHGAGLLLVDIDAPRLLEVRDRFACHALVADIGDAADRRRVLEHCVAVGHEPDVLINAAGIEKASAFSDLGEAEVIHALQVNLVGTLLLTHSLLAGMQRAGRGHIISIASMAALKPIPFNAVYNVAKSGLVAFSLSLSKELAGSGVDATVICPSAVAAVGMWARASDQLSRNRLVEGSVVRPEAVSDAVLEALERRPRRVLVGSPVVRAGALLSGLSTHIDHATDRLSHIEDVYRERVRTDSGRRL